jgi:hypothetical protein
MVGGAGGREYGVRYRSCGGAVGIARTLRRARVNKLRCWRSRAGAAVAQKTMSISQAVPGKLLEVVMGLLVVSGVLGFSITYFSKWVSTPSQSAGALG